MVTPDAAHPRRPAARWAACCAFAFFLAKGLAWLAAIDLLGSCIP